MTYITRRNLLKKLSYAAVLPVLARCTSPPEQAEVLILGAGISGLYAAWLLQQRGIDALVVEASDRLGGRLLTLDHLKGRPEAGGQTLDAGYARTLALAAELGVGTYPRKTLAPGFAVHVNGELVASEQWAGAKANRLQGEERAVLPHQLADFHLDRSSPLASLDDWLDPRFADLDSRSLRAELVRAGASAEALRLAEILYDGRGLENISALFACRKRLVAKTGGGQFFRIRGGSARLPEAIAARLQREVHTRRAVRGISLDAQGVECLCADGRRYRGRFALSSIPFSVLRQIILRPQPSPQQWKIIDTLPYNKITQVKLAFRSRFWEKDGLPPAMISDRAFEKVFAVPAEDGELYELNCWIDGQRAAKLDDKESDPVGRMVVKEIAAARPAAEGQLEVLDVTAWGRNSYSQGAYHFWGPGQFTRFGAVARQPWGPVHWIGEHVAVLQQGIEGAMESAEREVLALLQRMGGSAAA
jgi:monoamine oxidase